VDQEKEGLSEDPGMKVYELQIKYINNWLALVNNQFLCSIKHSLSHPTLSLSLSHSPLSLSLSLSLSLTLSLSLSSHCT
jgi:hypothetical protein